MDAFYKHLPYQLSENELRKLFYNLLDTVGRYHQDGGIEEKKLAEGVINLLQGQIDAIRNQKLQIDALQRYVHIVFSLSDEGPLLQSLYGIGKREVCQVLAFNDVFSVGPISDLDTTTGQQKRNLWMMEHDRDYSYHQQSNQEHQLENMITAIRSIPDNKNIVIWYADNPHDQTGLRFVVHLLRKREQPINVVNVTELFNATRMQNADEITPYAGGLIDREHYQAIVKNYYEGIPLKQDKRRRYESEWLMLTGQDHMLRLWEEGTVRGSDENALDAVIVRSVIELEHKQDEHGFIKAGSVVKRVFETSEQLVGDSFLSYRIWILVNQGILAFRGLPGALHQFSVKLGIHSLSPI
ncbi:Protein of unknown function [Paenibacillus sp. UNC496MF]|uniref:DUF1835 domain-containing protein n=1 Tax=Paenibacillus sp. UNC496MF TaxID=1502753 RepID=UPI0008EA6D97|nr:DUF1835 domain-containing protein [Paenibacillus sp. UNC496MF]SFJ77681.1 Protein of unknown function [Paenibacillus sp. UNC496MF]